MFLFSMTAAFVTIIVMIIGSIITGAFSGWLASKLMNTHGTMLENTIIGIIGGMIGGFACRILGIYSYGYIFGLGIQIAGACLCIWLVEKYYENKH